ncbi:MAG: hypothetical protein AAFV25_15070, partial [Bacteroidota bacterium]
MKQSYAQSSFIRPFTNCFLVLFFLSVGSQLLASEDEYRLFFPPPDITITCDYWFPFLPNDPNRFISEFDARFGKMVNSPANRDKIFVRDVVCPQHPKFSEFGPANPFDDPCYDDVYDIFWGEDGYYQNINGNLLFQNIVPDLTCGQGDIIREWRYLEPWGAVLGRQRITIINCKEFYVPTVCWRSTSGDVGSCDVVSGVPLRKLVEWPCDVVQTTCRSTGPDALTPDNLDVLFEQDRRPRLDDDNCSLLAATYEDRVFTFIDSACQKVFREWTVIDWCLFDLFERGLYSGQFEWKYLQVIKLKNQDAPDWENCEDQIFCGFGDTLNPNNNQCVGVLEIRPTVSDDCTPSELLRIDFKLDLFNDGNYDRLGYSSNYDGPYPFPNPDNLPVSVMPDTLPNADGVYPVGTHRILWAAEDGCGNASLCEYLITVEDCKPPTAYCLPGLSTIPMPVNAGGYVDIYASDFDLGSVDNCTADSNLVFAFSPDINDRTIRRTCQDVTGLPEQWTIYVFDEAGNYSSCEVGILLNSCEDQTQDVFVIGDFKTEQGNVINEVTVDLESANDPRQEVVDGSYRFTNSLDGEQYTVRPSKEGNPLNGISTYDLVLVNKHVLGIADLDSPYKMLAADVNCTGDITAFDLVSMRQLILYHRDEFPCEKTWYFIPADFVFTSDPFSISFPEVYEFTADSRTLQEGNFIGVKLGDVNASVRTGVLGNNGSSTRSNGALRLWAADRDVSKGEEVVLTIHGDNFADVVGYQYTLQFDPSALAYKGMQSDLPGLNKENFNFRGAADGQLATSWHHLSHGMPADAALYELRFEAQQSGRLSDWF